MRVIDEKHRKEKKREGGEGVEDHSLVMEFGEISS